MRDRATESLWRRSPDVAFVDDGDRVVLLRLEDPSSSRPMLLNGQVSGVWRALANTRTTAQIAANLGPAVSQALVSAEEALEALSAHRLVEETVVPLTG